jgi:hypothetical protein
LYLGILKARIGINPQGDQYHGASVIHKTHANQVLKDLKTYRKNRISNKKLSIC